jgi:glutamate/aspartate transport system substrate-binding protein
MYAKWFQSPIPPKNSNLNIPMGITLKGLLAKPNNEPVESYNKK